MEKGIITTEECQFCNHVFLRYEDHRIADPTTSAKPKQHVCPVCHIPVFIKIVQHPDEDKL